MKLTQTLPPQDFPAKGPIQVIERMATLLDVLSHHPDPVGLKQLAAESGLHPSTAHRILSALAANGLVERADPGNYRLGIRLLELGNIVRERIGVREAALPQMRELHARIGESVNLGMRHGDDIIYVERTSSGRSSVRVVHLVGARAPLHVTAVGKLYLAEEASAAVAEYARRTGLPGFTATSLTTLPSIEKELARVLKEGVAYDNEEIEQGLRCIAAPIRDDSGAVVAGLSVSAPAERYSSAWTAVIKHAADRISASLGYKPGSRTATAARPFSR